MKILKWLLVLIAALVAMIVAIAATSPVTASRILWPVVESLVLRDDFIGITSNGEIVEGLFEIQPGNVDTTQVIESVNQFVDSLDDDQKTELLFEVDDSEWRRWANIHIAHRQGVGFLDMNDVQQDRAWGILDASLSDAGFHTADQIVKLEGHLADLKDDHSAYGEHRYWFTVMGEPSESEPWGWQIDGHHLVINYFNLGDQVVSTPMFMGSEPVIAEESRFGSLSVMQDEMTAGLALINSLTEQQLSVAVLSAEKPSNNAYGELFQDNAIVPLAGILLSELSEDSQRLARQTVQVYTGRMKADHAASWMKEIEAHWSETRFAWVGSTDDDAIFYYRIQSPVIMIEFDHQGPVALEGEGPSRDHVHTVVRTPNGNDYGKDLLRQHLEQHPH